MLKVAVLGASGYTGAELIRLLACHPEVRILAATSESFSGQKLHDLYPGLGPAGDLRLTPLAQTELSPATVDVACLALPHGESQAIAPGLLQSGVKVIDLSGDFRFPDPEIYARWYQREHAAKEWADKAVYGLPELFRERIRGARFVANPGCFVTAAVLALYPLVRAGLVEPRQLIVDAKTGISGAGRKPKPETMFTHISENVVPYKLAGTHQHTPEMELALSQATGRDVGVTFTPQLVPARRGILVTAYGRLTQKADSAQLTELYREQYRQEPFVVVRGPEHGWPDLASAVGSNRCVLRPAVDDRTGLAVVVGAIDNLIKGAAGQAVQNLNLMFGLDETTGLPQAGFAL